MTDSGWKWGVFAYLLLMVATLIFLAKIVGRTGTEPVPSPPVEVVVEPTLEPTPSPIPDLCERLLSFRTKEELWEWLAPQPRAAVPPFNLIGCFWDQLPKKEVLYRWDRDAWDYLPK